MCCEFFVKFPNHLLSHHIMATNDDRRNDNSNLSSDLDEKVKKRKELNHLYNR